MHTPPPGTRRRRALLAAVLAAGLAGCVAGPDFVRPAAPGETRYTAGATPLAGAGGGAQHITPGKAVPARWWRQLGSPALDAVMRRALAANQSLAAARATLAAAQQNVVAARGGLYPKLQVSAGASRSAAPEARLANLYTLGPEVSYAMDAFGGTQRTVEQARALADLQRYQLAAAWLTLTGGAAGQAITSASLRAQVQATEDVIAIDEQTFSLVRQEFAAGKVARTDVLTAQTQLASDRATLPALRQQQSVARHALAILAGSAPAAWSPPDFALDDFRLPAVLPLSLPSSLVRQRPDILAAEAQLHADSAAIGIATAHLYPSITLSASFTQQSLEAGALFNPANAAWNLSAGLLAPVFEGGTLRAQRRAAVATYEAALANYRQTVLQAFQQVADTLRALGHDGELVAAERQVLDTARESLRLQRLSYAAGKSSLLPLIDAERAYQQARLGLARARAQRLTDTVQLFVALGGAWSRHEP